MKKKKTLSVWYCDGKVEGPLYCPICDEEDILLMFKGFPRPDRLGLCKKHKGKMLLIENSEKDESCLHFGSKMRLVDEKEAKKAGWKYHKKRKILWISTEYFEKLRKEVEKARKK